MQMYSRTFGDLDDNDSLSEFTKYVGIKLIINN